MYHYITRNKPLYLIYTFFLLISSSTTVLIAFFMSEIVNVAAEGEMERLWRVVGYSILFLVLAIGCEFAYDALGNRILYNARTALKSDLLDAILKKKAGDYEKKNSADYMTEIQNNVDMYEGMYFNTILTVPYSILGFIIAAGVCIYLEPAMLMVILVFSVVSTFVVSKMSKLLAENAKNVATCSAEYTGEIKDDLGGYRLVTHYGLHRLIHDRHRKKLCKVEKAKERNNTHRNLFYRMMELIGLGSTNITMGVAAYFALRGAFPIGVVLAFGHLSAKISQPIESASKIWVSLKSSKPIAKSIMEILQDSEHYEGTKPLYLAEGIHCNELSFSIGDKHILKGFSHTFAQGKKVLITGESGCGKSTLLNLLSGFYDTYEGNLLFDRIEQKDISRTEFAKNVAYVDQDVFLFNDTLRNNLTLFGALPEDHLEEAINQCELRQLVEGLEEGLDTVVTENGSNFSGGEKARLHLARAILANRSILLLDEITAQLDPDTTGRIEEMVLGLSGKTVISVAHKMPEDYAGRYDERIVM